MYNIISRIFNPQSEYKQRLQEYNGEIHPETIDIVAYWEMNHTIREALFKEKGPVLESTVKQLQHTIRNDPQNSSRIEDLAKRVDEILFGENIILTVGEVQGCGVLHTS